MYLMAQDEMRRAGYRHYEISNWALSDMRSRHNLTYWRNMPYLGVGPRRSLSYLAHCRFSAIKSPREYTRRMQAVPRCRLRFADTLQDCERARSERHRTNRHYAGNG